MASASHWNFQVPISPIDPNNNQIPILKLKNWTLETCLEQLEIGAIWISSAKR